MPQLQSHLEGVLDVDHVAGDDSVLSDAGGPLEHVAVVLADERRPVGVVRRLQVHRHQAVVGRPPVSPAGEELQFHNYALIFFYVSSHHFSL